VASGAGSTARGGPCGGIGRRTAIARPEPHHEHRLLGPSSETGQLQRPGEHGVDRDPVAFELQPQELAASIEAFQPLAHERAHLLRRAAHRQRPGSLDREHGPAGQAGVERIGQDRQVGQLGHASDCTDRPTSREEAASPCGWRVPLSIVDPRCVC
jgi:hypothetical protein